MRKFLFRRTSPFALGYDKRQVDTFFSAAKVAYESSDPKLRSSLIRNITFKLRRRGYSPKQVDAALDRLERACIFKERQAYVALHGSQAWKEHVVSRIQQIADRLQKPPRKRFIRENWGYEPNSVDRVLDRVLGYLRRTGTLSEDEVRSAVFRPSYRGYKTGHVDAYLDEVRLIIIMLEWR